MKIPDPLSLRWVVIAPFFILFTAAALFISWVSQDNARNAAESLGYEFAREIGNRIESHIHHLTSILPTIAELNRDAWADGVLNIEHLETIAPRLVHQIRHFPHMTFISLGFADGRYIAASRKPVGNDSPRLSANFLEGEQLLADYRVRPDGTFGKCILQPFPYDPRKRPFMTDVEGSRTPKWSRIEPYAGYRSLGLGVAAPVYDGEGRFLGVAAVSMALERVNTYMQGLSIGKGGFGFLAERNGNLIATSTAESLFEIGDQGARRLHLSDHPNPALAAAAPALADGDTNRRMVMDVGGVRYLYGLRTIGSKYGQTWVLGVILPQKQFMRSVERSNSQARILCLTTLFLVTLMGLYLAKKIAGPIERISRAAMLGAKGAVKCCPNPSTSIREIDQLSDSLYSIAGEVQTAIDSLEERVAQRTAELEAANAKLLILSTRDGLTGLINRRTFDIFLERECRRAERTGKTLSLVMCDIDYFKSFNDRHGHQVGDDVLKKVARCLEKGSRHPMDSAARYGGEEFALILPGTDVGGALTLVSRIRNLLGAVEIFNGEQRPLTVTLSFGVATRLPHQALTPAELITRADARLYAAKEAGRNCVMADSEGQAQEEAPC
ncbi:MAG: diguanylate cyclase [Desulfobacteraceae bacterium]|nr:diguanylate cyclase [Desulfobacteraceae bacterium]